MENNSDNSKKTGAQIIDGLRKNTNFAPQPNQNTQNPQQIQTAGQDNTLQELKRFFPSIDTLLPNVPTTDKILASYVQDGANYTEPPAVVRLYKETKADGERRYIRAMSAGDLSEVVGYAKSRKTAFCKMVARAVLMGGDDILKTDVPQAKVLYIDTEQSDLHAQNSYNDITKGLNEEQRGRLQYVKLREYSQNERLYIVCRIINEQRPTLAVIDGVADMIPDTNSNTDAPVVTNMLMALASTTKTHICTILHTSAANASKGRGHIGSEMERKAESVILIEKQKGTNTSDVKPQYTRNGDFHTLQISHTDDGLLLDCESDKTAPDNALLVQKAFDMMEAANPAQKQFNATTTKEYIQAAWRALGGGDGLTDKAAGKLLPEMLADGLLFVEPKGASKLYSRTPLQRREAAEIHDETQTMDFDTEKGKEAENGR
ncbi:MAG: AAA family ATPase [Salinivirgaceae bacterium]|nr:AAA family ATPase [Salinivirgaceae bacterium]